MIVKTTNLNMSKSASDGLVFLPDNNSCNLLTLCVAVETGVIDGSLSFRYLLPVSGVRGARDFVCWKSRE